MSRRFTRLVLPTKSDIESTLRRHPDRTGKMMIDLGLLHVKEVLSGKALHIFVEGRGMYSWFESMGVKTDGLLTGLQDRWRSKTPQTAKSVCIHWEYDDIASSLLLMCPSFYFTMSDGTPGINVAYRTKTGWFRSLIISDRWWQIAPEEEIAQDSTSIASVLSGLACYLEAFPECLKDGAPSDITSLVHYGGCKNKRRRMTLSVAPQLQEEHSIAPHFRRGHFRVLNSEKFTRKRGQVVFVRSTFVLGKAQTVTEQIAQ